MNEKRTSLKNKTQPYINRAIFAVLVGGLLLILLGYGAGSETAVYAQNSTEATPTVAIVGNAPAAGQTTGCTEETDGFSFNNAIEMIVPITLSGRCIDENTKGIHRYFKFTAKTGKIYQISTNGAVGNLDTELRLYLPNQFENPIAQNDDKNGTDLNAEITYQATTETVFFIEVRNNSNIKDDFSITVSLIEPATALPTTPTPTPEEQERIEFDDYEDNFGFETAFVIAADEDTFYEANFVPVTGDGPDNDFYKLWVKTGWSYTCVAGNLSPYNDTNMILYDQNRNGLGGNDDREPGDLGSEVSYQATYTGWLYVLVGPNIEVDYTVSDEYTYELSCTSIFATVTPTPWPTLNAAQLGTRTAAQTATAVSVANADSVIVTVAPAAGQVPTIEAGEAETLDITFTKLDQDEGGTASQPVSPQLGAFTVEIVNETAAGDTLYGVENMPVALYSTENGGLLAFGYTDPFGRLTVDIVIGDGSGVDVVIPYFGLRQTVTYPESRFVRVALPSLFDIEDGG